MDISPAELADRYTIVALKLERNGDLLFKKELDTLAGEVLELKRQGLMQQRWVDELYRVNSKIWNLESKIKDTNVKKGDLSTIGSLALQVRIWNNRRTDVKRKITKKIGVGFIDRKKYYVKTAARTGK